MLLASALRIAKMIQQPFQARRNVSGIGMQDIQLNFAQMLRVEDQMAGNGQHIFHQLGWSHTGQRPDRKHPLSCPRQQVVGQVSQQHQRLLRREDLFAPPAQLQAAFVGLDFRFACTPRIVVRNHLGWQPVLHRADHDALLEITARIAPAQRQPLDWAGESHRGADRRDPAVVRTQFQPGIIGHLPDQGSGTPPAAALGHDLPVVLQGRVHVAITPKARIRAQNGPRFLRRAEGQKGVERRHHRQVGGTARLFAGVQP